MIVGREGFKGEREVERVERVQGFCTWVCFKGSNKANNHQREMQERRDCERGHRQTKRGKHESHYNATKRK